ncbi:MAG: bifunctional RNase H/acid phosphatase [Micromonosporaceae bacterium]|nr:bifunctional RNase H/acid phosphatase [Micromonosporaceae bacterium]
MTVRVVVEADGGARGNPGPAGWGALVRDPASGEVLVERSEAIGTATNNVAEYGGLIAGLQAAADLGASEVEVRMDSKLVIEQMAGRWKIRHPGLRPLAAQAAALLHRFDRVSWQWVPRERNRDADRLANQAMDAAGPGAAGNGGAPPKSAGGSAGAVAGRPPAGPRPRGGWEPPGGPPTRLVLVRHGATERTEQRRYAGRADIPLSPAGEEQAEVVARRVAQLVPELAAVVTSPLSRCTATAAAIAAAAGAVARAAAGAKAGAEAGDPPVVVEPDLVECDLGQWEGRTFDEIRARWPEQLDAWLTTATAAPPGGESLQQLAKRVRRVGASLREAYPDLPVVVVSHVWPLKVMLRDALAAGDAFLHRLVLSPAGISLVDSYPEGVVAVRTVNDTSHLPR